MTVLQYIYLYLLTIPVFVLGDLLWLGVIARNFYQEKLEHLLGAVQWPAAIVFYFIYTAGILYFTVLPELDSGSVIRVFLIGALLGFFAYATYDLTNMATLRDWPLVVVVVDIIWGAVLTGSVASVSYLIGRAIL